MQTAGSAPLPANACCKKCGYALAQVPGTICPECGGAFDRANPRTFDASPAHRWWRRRGRWIVVGVVIVALGVLCRPRGYVRTDFVWCPPGQPQERVRRWQMLPPRWMGSVIAYPWWTETTTGTGLAGSRAATSKPDMTFVYIEAKATGWFGGNGGALAGWGETSAVDRLTINGETATRENAGRVTDAVAKSYFGEGGGGIELKSQ